MSILELFCSVDDFMMRFAPQWQRELLSAGKRQRVRATQMHPSEMMTIVIDRRVGLLCNYIVGQAQGQRMVAIADVQRPCHKGDMRIGQRTHHQLSGTTARHEVHLRLDSFVALISRQLAIRGQDAQVLRAAQDAHLHIHAVHPLEQAWLEYLGGAGISHNPALEE